MAKVMVSFPADLLERLDGRARRHGKTRSGFLRELVERELATDADERRSSILELLKHTAPHNGKGALYVREQRRAR